MTRRFLFDDRKRADARQIAEAMLLFCDRLPGKSGLWAGLSKAQSLQLMPKLNTSAI